MKDKYIDNLSKEESNMYDEVSRELIKIMLPRILYELISNQVLERKRLNDKEYVITVLRENLSKIKLPNIPVAAHEPLIETLKSEIKANRDISAVIVAGICVEHLLNHFYQNILPIKYGMDNKEVAYALKSLNIPAKIGWFLKITTNNQMPDSLKNKIISLNNIRNDSVHYRAIPEDWEVEGSGSHNELRKKLEVIKSEQLLDIITEFEEFLEGLILEIDDDFKLAFDICNKYLF